MDGNGNSLPEYPGYVSRQGLSDFCIDRNSLRMIDSGELWESIEEFKALSEKTGEDYTITIHSLQESIMENTGYQRAMRDVTEWARQQAEEVRAKARVEGKIAVNAENIFAAYDDPIEILHLLIGASSKCWENVEAAGVYQSNYALELGVNFVQRLRELGVRL